MNLFDINFHNNESYSHGFDNTIIIHMHIE